MGTVREGNEGAAEGERLLLHPGGNLGALKMQMVMLGVLKDAGGKLEDLGDARGNTRGS